MEHQQEEPRRLIEGVSGDRPEGNSKTAARQLVRRNGRLRRFLARSGDRRPLAATRRLLWLEAKRRCCETRAVRPRLQQIFHCDFAIHPFGCWAVLEAGRTKENGEWRSTFMAEEFWWLAPLRNSREMWA